MQQHSYLSWGSSLTVETSPSGRKQSSVYPLLLADFIGISCVPNVWVGFSCAQELHCEAVTQAETILSSPFDFGSSLIFTLWPSIIPMSLPASVLPPLHNW